MGIWALMALSTTLGLGQKPTPPADVTKTCWNLLNDAAVDKNPDVRKDAAEALSLVPLSDTLLARLDSMLDDKDAAVRIAVISTLGDFKDKRSIPLLRKALSDPVPEVDFNAAKVLYQLHDPQGEKFFLAVIAGEAKGSSSYLSKERRNALRMLHTPTKLFMFAAMEAVGFVPVPGVGMGVSSAQGILSNPESSARSSALLLIARSQDPGLNDVVEIALYASNWSERAAAAHVVAIHPFPKLRQELVPLLQDKKYAVRLRAAAAYIRLQDSKTRE